MKLKPSALVSGFSGKLNGSVASRNRGGAYLRNKAIPLNPKTSAQALVRSSFGSLSKAWGQLTEAQRKAWNGAVSSWQTTDVFGDLKSPSGINLFMRLNTNLATVGATGINFPPVPGETFFTPLGALTMVGGGASQIALGADLPASDTAMIVESTAGFSAGINNANSRYRLVTTASSTTGSALIFTSGQDAKFGAPIDGLKYSVRVTFVNTVTGQKSVPQTAFAIAAP